MKPEYAFMKPEYTFTPRTENRLAGISNPETVDVVREDTNSTTKIATNVTFQEARLIITLDKTQLELAAARIAMKGAVAALSQPVMEARPRTQKEKARAYDILVGDVKAARSLLT